MDLSFSESGVRQANRLYLPFIYHRVHAESWILKKVLKFVQLFSRRGKSLEEMKSGKSDKKSWVFFFKSTTNASGVNFFFVFFLEVLFNLFRMFAAHHEKKLCSCVSRALLSTCLITLSLEKEIIVLEKGLEKVLNFGSKNLCEPCYQLFAWQFFSLVFFFVSH